MADTPKHPGKTPAQRRVLDAIGCGDFSPSMGKRTKEALLEAGMIVRSGMKRFGTGPLAVYVQEYCMPIHVHMEWCKAVAAEFGPEDDIG